MKHSFESQPTTKSIDADEAFQSYLDREKTFDELVLMSDITQWIQKEEQEVYADIKAEYEKLSGLDRRIVDDIFSILKKEELLEESLSHLARKKENTDSETSQQLDSILTTRSAQLADIRAQRDILVKALGYDSFENARTFFENKQAHDNRIHPFDHRGIGLN